VLNHLGWDDDRHCQNGLLDFPLDASTGERGVVAPLAHELMLQQALCAESPADPVSDGGALVPSAVYSPTA
jgi:hypothetical protein